MPAHIGVPGNEAADIATKEATGWRSQGPSGEISPTPLIYTPLSQLAKLALDPGSTNGRPEQWRTDITGGVTHKNTTKPSKHMLDKFATMSRSSRDVGIGADKNGKDWPTPLLIFHRSRGLQGMPMWGRPPNGLTRATVLHRFDELREKLWEGKRDTDISILLGFPG